MHKTKLHRKGMIRRSIKSLCCKQLIVKPTERRFQTTACSHQHVYHTIVCYVTVFLPNKLAKHPDYIMPRTVRNTVIILYIIKVAQKLASWIAVILLSASLSWVLTASSICKRSFRCDVSVNRINKIYKKFCIK